ncbi:RyR domain-containing protein [Cysteiniphilum marinum]|uniref:RyR domain-containing protein n=1 Tax=Cysteiniphilum marinum TaxID=2774191 RepID=UPI00193C2A40|nr:RyR domain-containing protein [Cysteiniphilum marinum]
MKIINFFRNSQDTLMFLSGAMIRSLILLLVEYIFIASIMTVIISIGNQNTPINPLLEVFSLNPLYLLFFNFLAVIFWDLSASLMNKSSTRSMSYSYKIGSPIINNCNSQSKTGKIAKIAHEINKSYCEALGDTSQPTWEDAPQWQKDSVMNGVNFHLNNPNLTPEQNHKNWLDLKINDGWTYGKEKDVENKKHPCVLPYEELPKDQRLKNVIFRQVVVCLKDVV